MAKQMVYFNASKQIETITIHYNNKLDGTFVEDVCNYIKEVSKKMSKVNLKNPKDFECIQVFVYPDAKMFNKVFGGEIEKRFYNRKRSLEDLYIVQDSEGNIHIVSPRGKAQETVEALKKILVMKVLGEYMDEKDKKSAENLLKAAMQKKKEEELDEEELEEEEEELEQDEEEELEEDEEELNEEELEELIATEELLEDIDAEEENIEEKKEKSKEEKRTEAQTWLYYGWINYVKGKLNKQDDVKSFAEHVSKKGVKKLKDFKNAKLFGDYDFSEEYACAMVRYIVETYGTEKFTAFYSNPTDIKGTIGITKQRFNTELKAFIYSRYTQGEMKMEMDQKGVKEITEVHFEKNGGVDITKDSEVKEQEKEIKIKIKE